jgi:hypothetical protein
MRLDAAVRGAISTLEEQATELEALAKDKSLPTWLIQRALNPATAIRQAATDLAESWDD